MIVLSLQKANAKELDFRDPYLSLRKSRSMFVSIIFYILEENNLCILEIFKSLTSSKHAFIIFLEIEPTKLVFFYFE